jgi:hypothetical protein
MTSRQPSICNLSPNVSPAAVVYEGELYVFYSLGAIDGAIIGSMAYSKFNGSSWGGTVEPSYASTTTDLYDGIYLSLVPVAYNGNLYVYSQGAALDGLLYCTVYNGSTWSALENIYGVQLQQIAGQSGF